LAFVAVRAATATFGVNLIVLYFTGIATLLSAPWALLDRQWPDLKTALVLIVMGAAASVGQIGMTKAYGYAKAGLVSTMGLMTAGFSTLFAVVILHETLSHRQWAGVALMMVGIFAVTLRGYQEKRI
jgi:drug/metabolite transporter (DMT)-like permease